MDVEMALNFLKRKPEHIFINRFGIEITFSIESVRHHAYYVDMYNVHIRTKFLKHKNGIANYLRHILRYYFGLLVLCEPTTSGRETVYYTFTQRKKIW